MKKIGTLIITLFSIFIMGTTGRAQASLQIVIAPPAIQVYDQPACPSDGYIWTPGYWAYGPDGYYWVPGSWMEPTEVGFLWTPGYWDFVGGYYGWHRGYWGTGVGYYGGVNYGYGYNGNGYGGGRWKGSHFMYNTAVSNVSVSISHNTYSDRSVVTNNTSGRSSFHGSRKTASMPTAAHPSHGQNVTHSSAINQPVKPQQRSSQPAKVQHTAQPNRQQTPQQHAIQPSRQQQAPQQHASQPARQQAPQEHSAPQNRGGEGHPH